MFDIRHFLSFPPPVRTKALSTFCLTAFFIVFTFVLAGPVQAASPALTLTADSQVLFIGPQCYITQDPERNISLKSVVDSFQSRGLKGKKSDSELINQSLTESPFWILFEIQNNTDSDNWVLDFGDAMSGRMALASQIMVMNASTQTLFVKSPGLKLTGVQDEDGKAPDDVFLGSSLPITLKTRSSNLIALYIQPDNGFPVTLAPRVLSQKKFMDVLLSGNPSIILGGLFFVIVMAVFTTFLYMTRQSSYLFFLLHYAAICVLFFLLNQEFLSGSLVSGPALIGLYSASIIFALLHTKYYLRIEHNDHPIENFALIGLGLIIALSTGIYLFVLGQNAIGFGLYATAISMSLVISMVVCLFLNKNMHDISRYYCAGWVVHLLGFLVLCLGTLGLIPVNGFTISLFWLSFVPEAALFVAGSLQALKYDEKLKKQEMMRQKHDTQALARLQKSKESADQARLLRVIERERELMSELREREIQRAEEMRYAKEMADRANMAKSAFLAVVSHEIRTPMTGIMGMVQLLQDTNMNKTQSDYVDTIRKSGETMMTLLNDILDFEKIERGSMDIEEVQFDLPRLAQDVVTLMSGHAAQKNLSLTLETSEDLPTIVSGDPTRIRQILLNLVNNGLKFTQEGGVIIRMNTRKPGKKEVYSPGTVLVNFSVIDTGIGISKEAQAKLFTPFSQAEASITRKYGGTGLGLAISDRLIDAMGGKIRVMSEVGKGTEFSFELPLLEEETVEEIAEPLSDEELITAPMKILVVEDNEMNRKVLLGLLSKYDHEVLLAANGFEAIEQCEQERPVLIFMDIQMHGMDGLEAARKIRANSNADIAHTPIIALTGNVMPDEIKEIYDAQINGFLAKPVDPRKLNEVIFNAAKGKFDNPLAKEPEPTNFESLTSKDLGLELDDRELYTAESESVPLPVSEDNTAPNGKDAEFSFDEFRRKLEEEDEAEADPLDYGEDFEIEETGKKRKNDLSFGDDEELTEIQKFLLSQQSGQASESASKSQPLFKTEKKAPNKDKEKAIQERQPAAKPAPPPETKSKAMPQPETPEKNNENLLDTQMLQSLVDTLGKDQFKKLLEGFLTKADEIVGQIHDVIEKKDIAALAARSHELKGMAANFGMSEVSKIAAEVEKASKTSNGDLAIRKASLLEEASKNTKVAFTKWLGGLN